MQVLIQFFKSIEVNKAAQKRIAKAQAEGLCVACMQPLDDKRTIRGCHERCNKATIRAIQQGQTTEAERISAGKWLPKDTPGRKPTNHVTLDIRGAQLT